MEPESEREEIAATTITRIYTLLRQTVSTNSSSAQVYIADGHLVVVVELASQGELFNVLSGGPVAEHTARHLFRQLVAAVSYCHGAHVVGCYGQPKHSVYRGVP